MLSEAAPSSLLDIPVVEGRSGYMHALVLENIWLESNTHVFDPTRCLA